METDTAGLNPARQGSNCFCRLTGRVLSCCPASWPRSAAASWSYCHFGYIPVGRMEYRLEKQWSKVAQKQASRQAARPRILLLRIQCLVLTAWVTRKRARRRGSPCCPFWPAGPALHFTALFQMDGSFFRTSEDCKNHRGHCGRPEALASGAGSPYWWEPVRFDRLPVTGYRLPVKPVRSGFGLDRYQTDPNLKFKFELKKMKNS